MIDNTVPRWLIAEDVACERWFVVHTELPRFFAEIFDEEETGGNIIGLLEGEVVFIDETPSDVSFFARLMREAGDALNEYDRINDLKAEKAKQDENQEDF